MPRASAWVVKVDMNIELKLTVEDLKVASADCNADVGGY